MKLTTLLSRKGLKYCLYEVNNFVKQERVKILSL